VRRLAFALFLLAAPAGAGAQERVEAGAGFGAAGIQGCRTDLLYLNQVFGWQASWQRDWESLATASDVQLRAAIAQWRTAPAALRNDEAALANSARGGAGTAARLIVERVLGQVDALAARLARAAPPLRADADPDLRRQWAALFADEIAPAVTHYRDFLRATYLPAASSSAGLSGIPDAARCFRQAVRTFTSLDLPPEEIEALGNRLLHETEAELTRLYRLHPGGMPALLARLRDLREPGFDADRLLALTRAAIARATAAMPRMFFGGVGQPVLVDPMPAAMEADSPAGLYRYGENGRPAAYVINLSRPQERRLMAEVIAFHETLPGHHIRAALGLPAGQFNSGYAEGWGLYAEYLADEMGLYSSPTDRAGMMAKHLWAASRLVVEPGLHLHGWTRTQAIAFMREHTALTDAEIAVEVDRYIATPGQSLSYMLGYDRIRAARTYAERRLGRRFDLRQFHQIVLGPGSRPLDQMVADVHRWADATRGG
jgi:uncharacterized protein (DUF885 family)